MSCCGCFMGCDDASTAGQWDRVSCTQRHRFWVQNPPRAPGMLHARLWIVGRIQEGSGRGLELGL